MFLIRDLGQVPLAAPSLKMFAQNRSTTSRHQFVRFQKFM